MPGREARPQAWQRNFGVRRACDARHRESTDERRPKPEKVQWRGQVRRSSIISIVSGRHFTKRRIPTEIEPFGSEHCDDTCDRIGDDRRVGFELGEGKSCQDYAVRHERRPKDPGARANLFPQTAQHAPMYEHVHYEIEERRSEEHTSELQSLMRNSY